MTAAPIKTHPRNLFAGMNKTEKAFALELEAKKRSGTISEWFYESVTFKLGHDCRYTPDFMTIDNDGLVTFQETKGFMRDDALVKLKTMVKQFPFALQLWQLDRGVWTITDLSKDFLLQPVET